MGFADFLSDAGLTSESQLHNLIPAKANSSSAEQLVNHSKLHQWVCGPLFAVDPEIALSAT